MAKTLSPYGMLPVKKLGAGYDNDGTSEFPMTSNVSVAIATGDPVGLVSGTVVAVTATPTTTQSSSTPIGVFMGVSYQDPALGFVNRNYIPANLYNTLNGYGSQYSSSIKVKVADNPDYVFAIQADASVAATGLGGTIALAASETVAGMTVGIGNSNAVTGQSLLVASATSLKQDGTATQALKIVGFATNPSSAPGDTYTDLLVKWNAGVHYWAQSAGH